MKGLLLEKTEKPTIALCDDEREITDVYECLLSDKYNVLTFNHPEDLLKLLDLHKQCPFEILITDLTMPKMSGLQLIDCARKKGFEFPTILLSGYLDNNTLKEAVNRAYLRVLEKPVDFPYFLNFLEELLIESRK